MIDAIIEFSTKNKIVQVNTAIKSAEAVLLILIVDSRMIAK